MLRFKKEKILPVFLAHGATTFQFARLAKISPGAASRAVHGKRVSPKTAAAVVDALKIPAEEFLEVADE